MSVFPKHIYRLRVLLCTKSQIHPITHYFRSSKTIPQSLIHNFTMYHLDGNPAPSDQTLLKDLFKITTSKWQSMLKRDPASVQGEANTRPSVSRSSTQLSVPKLK